MRSSFLLTYALVYQSITSCLVGVGAGTVRGSDGPVLDFGRRRAKGAHQMETVKNSKHQMDSLRTEHLGGADLGTISVTKPDGTTIDISTKPGGAGGTELGPDSIIGQDLQVTTTQTPGGAGGAALVPLTITKYTPPAPTEQPLATATPATLTPTTETPTTQAPTTAKPTTEHPTTEPPTTKAPTTAQSTTNLPTTQQPTTSSPQISCQTNIVYTDVVIVGAGMAGIAAAVTLQNEDPSLGYIVLESTNRVGGRVRSTTFGVKGNQWTIEDGANWILDFKKNPIWELMEDYQLKTTFNDYTNIVVYDEYGKLVDRDFYQDKIDRFLKAWEDAEGDADDQWDSTHEQYQDLGVRHLLAKHGWRIADDASGNLDFMVEYFIIDWEYAAKDTSVRYFPYYFDDAYHITDPRGYELIPQQLYKQHANPGSLKTSSRVVKIAYNENIQRNDKTYKAVVTAKSADGCRTDYVAQRVISTVSQGVINNDLIAFDPPLRYSHKEYNPYVMVHYVKIFYQFPQKFWDGSEFVFIARDVKHRGYCHHWQNMDLPQYMPGSNMIRCEIMTEAFEDLIDPVTKDLTEDTLLSLLDPLRYTYGAERVGKPLAMYYNALNKDIDYGFGSYANWKIGYSFTDFARFFGGMGDVVNYCDHNGCSDSGDWVLHLSGAATCFDHAEFVHGAYFSGERSANFVLDSLGYDVKTDKSPCDVDFGDLERRQR